MTARSLQAVLRSLAAAAPAAGDGELLRRHLAGDEEAFAELVGRHGRLVWSVCRHLTGSDPEADDAFQATFLVLLKNAAKVRDAGRLSAWLHGVAYRVCAKARQATKRREKREHATAASERNGSAVPDSAWDRALAAVHEEAAKLPETLRVPFVLCCLEGKGVTEAAEQLGWKLGTLSGRLTRAKDALLARLDARGLTLGAVAGVGLASPPASAVAKATALARAGFAIPSSILQLSQGVIGMSLKSTKMLAAAMLVTCGLGLGLGKSWVATAEAQAPAKPQPAKVKPEDEVKRLQAELERVRQAAEEAARQARDAEREALRQRDLVEQQRYAAAMARAAAELKGKEDASTAKTAKWEYDFVAVSEMTQGKFVEFLRERETRGWEYNGLTRYKADGKLADIWVFRRPTKGSATTYLPTDYFRRAMSLSGGNVAQSTLGEITKAKTDEAKVIEANRAAEAQVIEDQIAELQARLVALKVKGGQGRVVIPAKDLPLEAPELAEVLFKLAAKNVKNAKGTFRPSGGDLIVEGDKQFIDWVAGMIKKLGEK